MERKLHGAIEFRTKAKSTIAYVVRDSTSRSVASTRMQITKRRFERFCVEQAEKTAGDLAPNEALGVLEHEYKELFHRADHSGKCITGAIHMPVTPYQPMGKTQRCSSTEDMWNTLAKHAKPQVQITEGQSPKEKPGLEWRDPVWTSQHGPNGAGYRETVCGRFTISKDAHELGFSYTAWRREDTFPPTILGLKSTAKEAMKLCEDAR